MGILLSRIPTAQDAQAGTYFLQSFNTPQFITAFRIGIAAVAVLFVIAFIYVEYQLKQDDIKREDA